MTGGIPAGPVGAELDSGLLLDRLLPVDRSRNLVGGRRLPRREPVEPQPRLHHLTTRESLSRWNRLGSAARVGRRQTMPRNAVRDEAGERADHNINLNHGQIIAALITAAGVIVAAFVTGAFSGHAVGLVSKPAVTVTTTVTAPGATGTGGSPAPSATPNGAVYWSGPVGITISGLELTPGRPSEAGPGGGIAYYGNTLSATNQDTVASLWTNSGTPSAAQCQSWVSTHPNTDVAIQRRA